MVDGGTEAAGQGAGVATRTPQQTLNSAVVLYGAFAMMLILLTAMAAFLTTMLARSGVPLSDMPPVTYVIAGVGYLVAVFSTYVSNRVGERAAREWADAGRTGSDLAPPPAPVRSSSVFGLDLGTPAQSTEGSSLSGRFLSASIVAAAMTSVAGLEGFVATIMTRRLYFVIVGLVIAGAFMYVNFPRRSTWDKWAASAGLTLPWE
jgi:hypothetical protein